MKQKLLATLLVALAGAPAFAQTSPTCIPQTTYTAMQNELTAIQTAKAAALKPLQEKLALATKTLTTAQADLATKQAALKTAQTDLTTVQNRITQINAQLANAATTSPTSAANLMGERDALKAQVASLQQRIAAINQTEANTVKSIELERTALQEQLAKLKAIVVTQPVMALPLFKSPAEIYTWVSQERMKLESAIKLQGEISRVQAQLTMVEAKVTTTKANFAMERIAQETEITRVNRTIELLSVAITEMGKFQQVDVAKLKAELETLMGRVALLKQQLPTLQTAIITGQARVKEAQAAVTYLNTQIASVSKSYDLRYDTLKQKLATTPVCK